MIQEIHTGGITYLEPLSGSGGWYWGTDWTSGDLYEAEELHRDGRPVRQNRLIFVHYPDGRLVEPVPAREGCYFGRPVWDGVGPVLLLADFPAGALRLLRYDGALGAVTPVVTLPRSAVPDCCNLTPHMSPLTLCRQGKDRFQIVWPERADFAIHPRESFCFRAGDRLLFSRWYEDPDYREEVVERRMPDGAVVSRRRGTLYTMPDGRGWLLTGDAPPQAAEGGAR